MVLQECPKCKTRITNNKAFDRVSELEKQVAELKVLNDQLTDANREHNKENAKLTEQVADLQGVITCFRDKEKEWIAVAKETVRLREALLSAEAATRTLRGALEKIATCEFSVTQTAKRDMKAWEAITWDEVLG
jgi:predicted RNase H-like nuclease (RuvC/YqgF family)